MLLLQSTVLLVATSISTVAAQAVGEGNSYTVWASVVLNRIGERTPSILGQETTVLTTTGAQQAYAAGSFFRDRYLTKNGAATIHGMSTTLIDVDQLYALAFDEQPYVASAQAFLQGLYPPVTSLNASTNPIDSTTIYNSKYVAAPLNGYQYAQVHAADIYDPEHVFINGGGDCPAFDRSARASGSNANFLSTQGSFRDAYQRLQPLLKTVIVAQALDFANAYAIYDFVSYQVAHNSSFAGLLPQYTGGMSVDAFLNELRYLADQEQQYELTNMTALNSFTGTNYLPLNTTGSISTIGGNFLAAKILANLQVSIQTRGQYYKLSTLFTDYEPMLSLFSLMALPHTSANFTGLPEYASSAVFELYSWSNTTGTAYPSTDSMYVRFHFRNGSDPGNQFLSYPAFQRGPSQTDMSWTDFNSLMYNIMLDDVGQWCTQCGAYNIFCAPWNSTLGTMIAGGSYSGLSPATSSSSGHASLSPAAAGAVGAIVALVVALLILALVMLLGGIRFHRRQSRKTSELGGFKGSSKMASDRDLVLPPQSDMEAAEDGPRPGAHERTGSWEMKAAEKRSVSVMPTHQERQRARDMDEEDLRVNPFANPVQARESF